MAKLRATPINLGTVYMASGYCSDACSKSCAAALNASYWYSATYRVS